ncbi:MAG TPA: cytochrome c [Burkholderiales bacterium]|nr:cytochrome c [Burkholderiales bacterium]
MRTKIWTAALALALGAGAAQQAMAQAKPDVLVKQRQAAMILQAKYLGPIGAMLKGNIPYNADVVSRNATYLETLAQMPWDGFQPSTQSEKTKAKPEIFKDPAKFQAAYERLEEETAKLGKVARAKDEAGVRATFGGVAKACGGCHDDFRQK